MQLDTVLRSIDFKPNDPQRKVIERTEGPVLVIAGPGSGKTQTLVARTLNLLLVKEVPPDQVMVCTFTEKAAATLKDRLRQALIALGKETELDLEELWVGTIHSICGDILSEHFDELAKTSLKITKGFDVLDDLTQQLFLKEHRWQIFTRNLEKAFPGRGTWDSLRLAAQFFNSITEELVNPDSLERSSNDRIARIGREYKRYKSKLEEHNSIDFAHLQSLVLEMLEDSNEGKELRSRFRYVMVDEYQDTNHVQERLFHELTRETKNLCVVGDDDQALYRFRGATVQNIILFKEGYKGLSPVILDLNYRSTPEIIDFVNKFIAGGNWSGPSGAKYRYGKKIVPVRKALSHKRPSVMKISSEDPNELAGFVKALISSKAVEDPNQIAVLLMSVRRDGPGLMEAFDRAGISYYAPRARVYFELEHVMCMLGALLEVLSHLQHADRWNDGLYAYYDECRRAYRSKASAELKNCVSELKSWLKSSSPKPKLGVVDMVYRLMGFEPFKSHREDLEIGHDLAIFTALLSQFQDFFHHEIIRKEQPDIVGKMKQSLFDSFLFMLWLRGMDEYEDPYQIFPKGKVQIMTIHQAKGLEFPIVIVGSLEQKARAQRLPEEIIGRYMERKPFEPRDRVPLLDHYRQFYVAFSRAMDILLLYWGDKDPNEVFGDALETAVELDAKVQAELCRESLSVSRILPIKPEYSLTGDIHVYDVCPRQYMFLNEFEFAPSIGAPFQFGTLVHGTIEDIHNHVLKGRGIPSDDEIDYYFERNARGLKKHGRHPLAQIFLDMAKKQIKGYVADNRELLKDIIQAEIPVIVQKPNYVLSGVVDLVRGKDGQPELLDFKASQREKGQEYIDRYEQQLALYGKMIEVKLGIKPVRYKIYWTGEEDPSARVQELEVSPEDIEGAERHFEAVVDRIENRDYRVVKKPSRDTCRNCDFRFGCPSCSLGRSVPVVG